MPMAEVEQSLNHFFTQRDSPGSSLDNTILNIPQAECDTENALQMLKRGEDVTKWRRVYTDGMIVKALRQGDIRCLDNAIIIAGAQDRQELVHGLVAKIQSTWLGTQPTFPPLPTSQNTPPTPHGPPAPVPRLISAPSLGLFRSTIQSHPFILPGYAAKWPATQKWLNLNYLYAAAGPSRTVPVEIGHDYRDKDWTQRLLPWDDFLSYLAKPEEKQAERWYMAQHNLFMQFPSLRDDVDVPDYLYSAPDGGSTYEGPLANEDGYIFNIWIGPSRTVSPAHTDPYFNFYVQLVGRKSIWFAPPSSSIPTLPEMKNTACIDVFEDDITIPGAMWVILEPGDVCCFPPGWWHAMRSEDTSISLSIWF